jgi:hypothetical protein
MIFWLSLPRAELGEQTMTSEMFLRYGTVLDTICIYRTLYYGALKILFAQGLLPCVVIFLFSCHYKLIIYYFVRSNIIDARTLHGYALRPPQLDAF